MREIPDPHLLLKKIAFMLFIYIQFFAYVVMSEVETKKNTNTKDKEYAPNRDGAIRNI
jgi:hypothetical protein